MISHPRRCPIWSATPLRLFIMALVLFQAETAAGNPADDVSDEDSSLPERQPEIADLTVYHWIFGYDPNGAPQEQLETLLEQKIAVVDRVCALKDTQKQTLLLAGRGDNKRIMDRFEKIEMQFQLVKNDPDKVNALEREVEPFTRGSRPGFRNDGSLFVKTLERTLTADQFARYEPLRAVYREGGVVYTFLNASHEVLSIDLCETAFADDGLATLSNLPGLQRLFLGVTQVTDAGLVHLKRLTELRDLGLSSTRVTDTGLTNLRELTKLKWLALAGTQVTDAGLAHLSGLTSLKVISLKGTQVTDDGIAKLKRALPGLKVQR